MNTQATPIAVLVEALRSAKHAEDIATAHRLDCEKAIIALYPSDKTEGSITDKDHGVTVTYKVTRSVDTEKLQQAWDSLHTNSQKAFKWTAGLDTKQYRAIQDLDPQSFAQLAQFVTTKTAKTAVTLKDSNGI